VSETQNLWRLGRRVVRDVVRRPTGFDDRFIEWLLLVNAGMQVRGNVHLFELAVRTAPEAPFLEIGSFSGLSTNIIQYLKRKHDRVGVPLYTCDKWLFKNKDVPLPAAAGVSIDEIRDYVRSGFQRSLRTFSGDDLPFTVEATSDEFFELWEQGKPTEDVFGRSVELGGPFGFCFIDGNHDEEFVQRDFDNCDRYLLPGGLILFDDSAAESVGAASIVAKRIARESRYEVVARNPNYLFRKAAAG
jgi:predicted O-methyltransferase YrrM